MLQLYASGSAQPIQGATMTYFVTTAIEPSLQIFIWGLGTGMLLTLIVCFALFYAEGIFRKWQKNDMMK